MANIAVFFLLHLIFLGVASQHSVESTATCPCLNGGTFTGDDCVCLTGFEGHFCETEIGNPEPYVPCDSSCNNGYCDYTCGTCVCHPFYGGDYCNITLTRPCGDYFCFNEGTCEMDASNNEYCQCPEGYSGEYCLYTQDNCFCLNGGSCITSANSTMCSCLDGFTGEHCETELCTPECPFNAYCCNGTCQCYPGYTGEDCTEVEDGVPRWERCGDHFCFNGGTCVNDTCVCAEGFGGDYCLYSTDMEICGVHVCYYGGICIDDTCHCPANTFGVYCEIVSAPPSPLTLVVTGHVTSATLGWSIPLGYEAIASSGGVWYTVTVENMVTGRVDTLLVDETTLPYSLMQSNEYCFRVRAEFSGGSGEFSDRVCYTAPDHGSCFCVNDGVYNMETSECTCQSRYQGNYCEESEEFACPAESIYNLDLGHVFEWSKTAAGQSVLLSCPCNSTLDLTSEVYATRSCSNEGNWMVEDDSGCTAARVKDLCEANSPSELFDKVSAPQAETLQAGGVAASLKAVQVLAMDETQRWPIETLLDSVDSALSVPDAVLVKAQQNTKAATMLVNTLDEIARVALNEAVSDSSWLQTRTNFALQGEAVVKENLPEEGFSISFGGAIDTVMAVLPSHLFSDASCNSSVVLSSIVTKTALFGGMVEDADETRRVVSPVLSVTLGDCTINSSMEAIEMSFKVDQSLNYNTLDCYYWKPTVNNGFGAWSKTGCSKKGQLQSGVICSCNHLTTFAVLQSVSVAGSSVPVVYIAVGVGVPLLVILLILLIALCVSYFVRSKYCTPTKVGVAKDTEMTGTEAEGDWENESATNTNWAVKRRQDNYDVETTMKNNYYEEASSTLEHRCETPTMEHVYEEISDPRGGYQDQGTPAGVTSSPLARPTLPKRQ